MTQSTPTDRFDEIDGIESKALLKPKPIALVVTQSETEGPNLMTAGWWMTAGYNPFRYMLGVSQKTYTYDIIEENPEFVLSVPSTELIDAMVLSGMVSGRELDKIEHLDLETIPGAEIDVPILADAVGNIECTVLDSFEFENTTYYFGSVEKAWVTEGGMDGRLLSLEEDVLAYMGSDWVGDDETKHRFYADLGPEDLESFPGDEVLESLPEELQEKHR
ncbi:NADH-FMN oxidoreductase RutF, flavin reductase (DIM6/NTAB) family [Halalkaliarchaeum sp. AArc-CO]|uniref:flavin reductase family protein n=1 Tax=unclassified Halalkaliarchaeum TaxID=2678344 RepID=UPI00217EDDD1|nr:MULTISPECIES: flavin reductase family protein [unclassified Halalkaliarchaeum]MDR5671995.1 flavin reductase family protein [Halalkaliarchaeum sp. AArc-GB]UWG51500.1 NADH-FMN oxidoreductase RutF, flavin reductase (DIM6/NTAB) family [Halalkaliarchaeum sp. AArc-CO]